LTFILRDGLILLYLCALEVCYDDDDDDDDDDHPPGALWASGLGNDFTFTCISIWRCDS